MTTDGVVRVDYRDKACGAVPEMQVILARADAEGARMVEFRVRAKMLPQVVGALGMSAAWTVGVEEGLDDAVVRFTRREDRGRPSLDII